MSDQETRPTKRTRLSVNDPSHSQSYSSNSSSTPPNPNLQRHPEIWFNDGNIVLVARETAFRIYRGLLASQSTVFSDMFASSTSSPDESFDGCPVVHLSDSPHDLAYLLRVLLPKSQINYRTTKEDPIRTFDEVSAVIRLAHKYHIPQVQNQAIALLQDYHFTDSFTLLSSPAPEPDVDVEPVHAIGAVNLARLTDTPSMLPLALYRCAYLGSALLDGRARGDGTIERLSDTDLRRCLDARVALTNERFFLVTRLFDNMPSVGCRNRKRCSIRLKYMHIGTMRSRDLLRVEAEVEGGVLSDWEPFIRAFAQTQSLCALCVEELVERVAGNIWD